MEAPGRLEEQPPVRRDRRGAGENMGEGGAVGARRMTALHRLVQLLRIAEQDDARGCWRHRHDVGQRDLASLIDEEDRHGARHLR